MISEGSCDTEDWSNDAENQLWSQESITFLKYIKIENSLLNCNNISQYYCFYKFL